MHVLCTAIPSVLLPDQNKDKAEIFYTPKLFLSFFIMFDLIAALSLLVCFQNFPHWFTLQFHFICF